MATIARLVVGLDADTSNLESGLARGMRQIASFASGLGALVGISTVTTALTLATQSASAFGHQMAEIATLLPDTSQIDALKTSIRGLSNEFGKSSAEEAAALYEIISAGASDATKATEILTTANKLAVGGVTDVRTAADGLTSVLAAYASAGLTATNVADSFFISAAGGKTKIEELSRSIGRVAPLASKMGVSLDEVTAGISALTKGGVSTNIAVDGLRAILAAVAKPAETAAKEAQRLGLQFNSAAIQSKGLAGFLETVTKATNGNADSMAKLFSGVEAFVPVLSLTANGAKDLTDSLTLMETKAGATATALAKIETLSPQIKFDRLKSVVSNAAIDIGDKILNVLVPAAESAVAHFGDIGAAISALAKAIAISAIITTLLSLSSAIRALVALETVATLLSLAKRVSTLADALVFARLAMTLFVKAIPVWGLVITGVTLLATAIFKAGEQTRQLKADTENYSKALVGLNRNQLEAAKGGVQLALAQAQSRLVTLGAGGLVDTAKNVFAIQRERDAIKALNKELAAIEQVRPAAPLANSLPTVIVGGKKGGAGGLEDAEAAAKALAKFLSGLNTGVQNLRTNFGLVADGQVLLTGLGEQYLSLQDRISAALRAQKDQLGETATALRGMLSQLAKTFAPDLSKLTSDIDAQAAALQSARDTRFAQLAATDIPSAPAGSAPFVLPPDLKPQIAGLRRQYDALQRHAEDAANALSYTATVLELAKRNIGERVATLKQQFTNPGNTGASLRNLAVGGILNIAEQFSPLGLAATALSGVFEGLQPVIDAVKEPLRLVGEILGKALAPILRALFPVFKAVAIAATYVGEVFFKVSAFILRAVGSLVRGLGNLINKLPGSPGDPLVRAGQALLNLADGFTEGANELAKGRDELRQLTFGGTADALNKTTAAANSLTDSLLNVPSGFRIAQAIYNATKPIAGPPSIPSPPISIDPVIPFSPTPSAPASPTSPRGGGGGGTVTIASGAIVVQGANKSPREIAKEVLSALQTLAYEQLGDSSRWPELA